MKLHASRRPPHSAGCSASTLPAKRSHSSAQRPYSRPFSHVNFKSLPESDFAGTGGAAFAGIRRFSSALLQRSESDDHCGSWLRRVLKEGCSGVPHVSIFETWGLFGFPWEAVPSVDEFDFKQWCSSAGIGRITAPDPILGVFH